MLQQTKNEQMQQTKFETTPYSPPSYHASERLTRENMQNLTSYQTYTAIS